MGLVKAAILLGFVATGLLAALAWRRPAERRFVNVFIAYTVVVSLAAGLFQREAWPFSTWPLVAGTVARPVSMPRIMAVDSRGEEHNIDYRSWNPYEFQELIAWKDENFRRLDRASQDHAAAFLLDLIERSRSAWAAGAPIRYLDKYLGPFSAPLFLGHPAYWGPPAGVPREPFVGLRIYTETWDVEERARDPSKVTRKLDYEYRKS